MLCKVLQSLAAYRCNGFQHNLAARFCFLDFFHMSKDFPAVSHNYPALAIYYNGQGISIDILNNYTRLQAQGFRIYIVRHFLRDK